MLSPEILGLATPARVLQLKCRNRFLTLPVALGFGRSALVVQLHCLPRRSQPLAMFLPSQFAECLDKDPAGTQDP